MSDYFLLLCTHAQHTPARTNTQTLTRTNTHTLFSSLTNTHIQKHVLTHTQTMSKKQFTYIKSCVTIQEKMTAEPHYLMSLIYSCWNWKCEVLDLNITNRRWKRTVARRSSFKGFYGTFLTPAPSICDILSLKITYFLDSLSLRC
jgi:hypothetical protein